MIKRLKAAKIIFAREDFLGGTAEISPEGGDGDGSVVGGLSGTPAGGLTGLSTIDYP